MSSLAGLTNLTQTVTVPPVVLVLYSTITPSPTTFSVVRTVVVPTVSMATVNAKPLPPTQQYLSQLPECIVRIEKIQGGLLSPARLIVYSKP